MKMKSRSKSSLFLMELIIVIMFFSLSAAICMKVFSVAKVKNNEARDLTNASFAAQSLAETYKAVKLDGTDIYDVYPSAKEYGGVYTIYYDSDWTLAEEYEGEYRATLTEHEEKYVTQAKIEVLDIDGNVIFDTVVAVSPDKGVK